MSRIWVLGATGQVGRALCALLGDEARGVTSSELDFLSPDIAERFAEILQASNGELPEIVINCAAYTNVEQAQNDQQRAMRINAEAPETIAQILAEKGIALIHTSTDYVFSGNKERPYHEGDDTKPCNSYGESKLAGEQAVMNANPDSYILRYSWVYDASAKNFLTKMLELMATQNQLRIVADQISAPSFANDLASATKQFAHLVLSDKKPEPGIYHCCAEGHTSWHGFASAIMRAIRQRHLPCSTTGIIPIVSEEFTAKAARPKNSRLATQKLQALGIRLPHWHDGLLRAMKQCDSNNAKTG